MKRRIGLVLVALLLVVSLAGCTSGSPGYMIQVDSNKAPVLIDPYTLAPVGIDFTEYSIHNGINYDVIGYVDLALNEVYDVQMVIPNSTAWTHFTFDISVESETHWLLYEGVSINTTGTAITPYNANRNSLNTSTVLFYGILNNDVAAANADTDVSGAMLYGQGLVGAGKDAGFISHDDEIIAKQNTSYTLRFIANTAGYVNYHISYYQSASN